jgi:hypothetical protein
MIEDCDDHRNEYGEYGRHSSCICEGCCVNEFGCCYCEGNINECIRDMLEMGINDYESLNKDHAKPVMRMYNILENWNKFDYHWNPKKIIKKIEVVNV